MNHINIFSISKASAGVWCQHRVSGKMDRTKRAVEIFKYIKDNWGLGGGAGKKKKPNKQASIRC